MTCSYLQVVSDHDLCDLRLLHGDVDGVPHLDVEVIHGVSRTWQLSLNISREENMTGGFGLEAKTLCEHSRIYQVRSSIALRVMRGRRQLYCVSS